MIRNITQVSPTLKAHQPSASKNIAESFKDVFDEVNRSQLDAESKVNQLATGKNKNIPATMIALEKAETSMKLLMAVRNKVITTYEEMMRMQV